MRNVQFIIGSGKCWLAATMGILLTGLMITACVAAPSFRGYTGLVIIPTARVLDVGEYDFGFMVEDKGISHLNDIFVNYSPKQNLEVGVNAYQPASSDKRKAVINAKYLLAAETEEAASVAVGVIDLADQVNISPYAVATKSIIRRAKVFGHSTVSLRGHAGFGFGDIDALFVGLSAYAGNRVMLSIEYDSHNVNLGFRFTPIKGLRLHTAILGSTDTDHVGLGISYTKKY